MPGTKKQIFEEEDETVEEAGFDAVPTFATLFNGLKSLTNGTAQEGLKLSIGTPFS